MRFWWVNHKQTYKQEVGDGYLWSPKTKKGGIRTPHYDRMTPVMPGDVVFSFASGMIRNVGVATHVAASSPKPDFGVIGEAWAQDGWMVPITWQATPSAVRPKEIISALRPNLPTSGSPLSPETGNGYQHVYLTSISANLGAQLLEIWGDWGQQLLMSASSVDDDEGAISVVDHEIEKAIQADNTILETERIALVRARVGQGQYRQNLMAIETQCRITGVKDPRLLRASHIKPWRSCATNAERLDGNNGLLLSPTVDHLFDRGYLSFTDAGGVMLSPLIDAADFGRLGLSSAAAATFGSFSLEQSVFLEYHRRVVFKRVAPAALP